MTTIMTPSITELSLFRTQNVVTKVSAIRRVDCTYRDVDNSRKAGKIPGCQHDFSGYKQPTAFEKLPLLPSVSPIKFTFLSVTNTSYIPAVLSP